MTTSVEDALIHMKENIVKRSKSLSLAKKTQAIGHSNAEIDITRESYKLHQVSLRSDPERVKSPEHGGSSQSGAAANVNEEWQHMFGTDQTDPKGVQRVEGRDDLHQHHHARISPLEPASGHNGNVPDCQVSLSNLLSKKRGEFALNSRRTNVLGYRTGDDSLPKLSWRPDGQLRAHMHEHEVKKLEKVYKLECLLN